MVKYLTAAAGVIPLLLLLSVSAAAEGFSDPTRPPPEALLNADGDVAAAGPVLQSVTISQHRKSALISGKEVLLGQKYEDAVLLKISDNQVTLRHPDGALEVLKMYSGVQKTIVPTTSVDARRRQHKTGN